MFAVSGVLSSFPAFVFRLGARRSGNALPVIAVVLCLVGCRAPEPPLPSTPPDPQPEPVVAEPVVAEPEVPQSAEASDADSVSDGVASLGAPLVEFQPQGLAPLYQGFMTDPAAIAVLRSHLAGRLAAPSVVLRVVWDPRDLTATITLKMPEVEPRFTALADAVAAGQVLDMDEVQPLFAAVGAYRADLGGRFDLRILSFDVRLAWSDAGSGSYCTLGGVLNDPQGTKLSPCFECLDAGNEVLRMCRTEEQWPSTLSGPQRGREMLSSALRSSL